MFVLISKICSSDLLDNFNLTDGIRQLNLTDGIRQLNLTDGIRQLNENYIVEEKKTECIKTTSEMLERFLPALIKRLYVDVNVSGSCVLRPLVRTS